MQSTKRQNRVSAVNGDRLILTVKSSDVQRAKMSSPRVQVRVRKTVVSTPSDFDLVLQKLKRLRKALKRRRNNKEKRQRRKVARVPCTTNAHPNCAFKPRSTPDRLDPDRLVPLGEKLLHTNEHLRAGHAHRALSKKMTTLLASQRVQANMSAGASFAARIGHRNALISVFYRTYEPSYRNFSGSVIRYGVVGSRFGGQLSSEFGIEATRKESVDHYFDYQLLVDRFKGFTDELMVHYEKLNTDKA